MSATKAASKVLATASAQDSIFKLLYAPFTFLSTGNEKILVDMLASAIGFLEGYSIDTLETDAVFERDKKGAVVARSQLKLVPYAVAKPQPSIPSSSTAPIKITNAAQSQDASPRVIERAVTFEQHISPRKARDAISQEQFDALRQCFAADTFDASRSFETLLQETSSPAFTKLAVTCYSQTGLTVSSSSFMTMLSTLARSDKELARKMALDYEFEMDLTSFLNQLPRDDSTPPLIGENHLQPLHGSEPAKRQRKSRLEQIRSKKKR